MRDAMTPATKIIIGALATTALAWVFTGPMHFGQRCADAAALAMAGRNAPVVAITPPNATPAAIGTCQNSVDAVVKGKTVNFANGATSLTPESIALVATLATALKGCDAVVLEIAGHTDARGKDAANMTLSEQRANAVGAALVAHGVEKGKWRAIGYGETRPLDPAITAAADARNRRIDFTVEAAPAN
jgi:outer membrane protein OmpA-like peptidoglycan-associated protein